MKAKLWILSVALLCSVFAGALRAERAERQRLLFDEGWRFYRGDYERGQAIEGQSWRPSAWRVQVLGKDRPSEEEIKRMLSTEDGKWHEVKPSVDAFDNKPGFAWFKAQLPQTKGQRWIMHFDAIDDKADVYLNGQHLIHHEGWNEPFDVEFGSAWKAEGTNDLAVLVENGFGGGNVGPSELASYGKATAAPTASAFDDSAWQQVQLPHDYLIEGAPSALWDSSHGFIPKMIGWYRKNFVLPLTDRGKSIWIDFDGIYRNSELWLNGAPLAKHFSGYTSFRCDISAAAHYGSRNVLVVKVNPLVNEGWWYEGAGIYRHVWLNKAARTHIKPWGVQVLAMPKDGGQASLELNTSLEGPVSKGLHVSSRILDAAGVEVLRLSDGKASDQGAKWQQLGKLAKAHLWSLEDPYLYRLVTELNGPGGVMDRVETRFGVRSMRFDAEGGFYLNDKPVKIQGVCNHLDYPALGTALPDGMQEWRIARLKEMGVNAWRCSHNPPSPEFLDACDRLGMLVMDENRKLGDNPEVFDQLNSMVLRDRNHPSIFIWSLCNEEYTQGTTAARLQAEKMKALVLELDPSRPVTAAMNGGYDGDGISKVVDVMGFNYHFDSYDSYHSAHPKQPTIATETGSVVGTRGVYVEGGRHVTAYDVDHFGSITTAESAWRAVAERPFMSGAFVWTGFDYKGEPTPFHDWPNVHSNFGILDICGFPKDSYYYYKSWWTKEPVLHLLPHWNWKGKEGQNINVAVYSNCAEVELELNGKSLGRKAMPDLSHLDWKVAYAAGVLKAKGYDKDGKLVLQDSVETTQEPQALRLRVMKSSLIADNEDAVPVEVTVVDAAGRVVPTAGNRVTFRVSGQGRLQGTGNGDPADVESDSSTSRLAFNGYCLAVVRAGSKPGHLSLVAESDGLKSATLDLESVAPKPMR